MKRPVTLLALFSLCSPAFALEPRLLGEARVTGGSEWPPVEFWCSVFETRADKILERGGQIIRQESTVTAYDDQVPTADAALALAERAAAGTIAEKEGKAGAPTHHYWASADGEAACVFLGSYGPRALENTSPQAQALRELVIRNCRFQGEAPARGEGH